MSKTSRWIAVAAFTALVAGCSQAAPVAGPGGSASPTAAAPTSSSSSSTPPATTTGTPPPNQPPPAATTVQITRSGGIAGTMQTVVISPDGSWVFTDRRTGTTRQGKLTAAQLTQLRQLVSAPALATEARRSPPPMACNDATTWTVTVGELTVHEQDCGGNYPATDAVIRFVTDNTAL